MVSEQKAKKEAALGYAQEKRGIVPGKKTGSKTNLQTNTPIPPSQLKCSNPTVLAHIEENEAALRGDQKERRCDFGLKLGVEDEIRSKSGREKDKGKKLLGKEKTSSNSFMGSSFKSSCSSCESMEIRAHGGPNGCVGPEEGPNNLNLTINRLKANTNNLLDDILKNKESGFGIFGPGSLLSNRPRTGLGIQSGSISADDDDSYWEPDTKFEEVVQTRPQTGNTIDRLISSFKESIVRLGVGKRETRLN